MVSSDCAFEHYNTCFRIPKKVDIDKIYKNVLPEGD